MIRRMSTPLTVIVVLGLFLGACNRTISTSKKASATPIAPTLDELSLTRTAIAGPIIATLTAAELTPASQALETVVAPTAVIPMTPVTPIPTLQTVTVVPTAPPVKKAVAPQQPIAAQPVLALPDVYRLNPGEFPFCIARRYNINPNQLMCLNGLCYGQIFYVGQALVIPRNPLPFPGPRALHPHPATWQVRPGDSVFKIACFIGDVDPYYLAQVNGLTPPFRLQIGQILNIP